jgi:hypothetical protein
MIECPNCKRGIEVEELLANVHRFKLTIRSAQFLCPRCRESVDIRVETGRITFGYVYSAGDLHFAAMEELAIDGLSSPDGSYADYGGRSWRFE